MPRAGLEPARCYAPRDFKSLASTNSAIRAVKKSFYTNFFLGVKELKPPFTDKRKPEVSNVVLKVCASFIRRALPSSVLQVYL